MRGTTFAGIGRPGQAPRPPPAPDDICTQLERIVASPEFPSTGQSHAFLRYVVEETLAGRAERIKGYSIAIEVFDRDEDFTQDDPVVRIEAGRLRRTLERYYLVAGRCSSRHSPILARDPKPDSIRSDLPRNC